MKKSLRFLTAFVLLTFIFFTLVVNPAQAFIGFIGANVLKQEIKHVVASTVVKQGIRATEKTALKRAEKAWFSRFTEEQIADITAAGARATPSGTPGWLKVTVGASMWLTGADIAVTLYDAIKNDGNVQYYTDEVDPTIETMVGQLGTYLEIVPVNQDPYRHYLVLKSNTSSDFVVLTDGSGSFNSYANSSQFRNEGPAVDGRNYRTEIQYTKNPNTGKLEVIATQYDTAHGDVLDGRSTTTFAWGVRPDFFKWADFGMTLVSSNLPNTSYVPPVQPTYVPNPYPDLFPNDDKAVEILVPDPAVYPDPDQAVMDNTDKVTEPGSNPNPQPNPDPNNTDPDPENWSKKMKGLVTTKFPFSLPWDLYRLLALLNADPVRPDIHVDQSFRGMPFKFDVTFEWLDPYMPFFRGFIIISFCVMLVHATRRLMGGST
jgi:hypothetical protein